ncbi:site-2 protease family protein, partial [uncultured Muriicola sp.]|uniref:site-2 protease family protein n=1 Tax=uncultured Muriicola sp. TaxID=1583102 RepID=UPI0026262CE1
MDTLIIVTQLILSLSILVTLHECGHFFPAKWFKTKVEKFYLFFDPWFSLWKTKKGERAYPPLLLFKCFLLQKWFQIKSDPELESQINDRL